MDRRLLAAAVAIVTGLEIAQCAMGLETDQFTVPPQPLADIGPQVSDKVHQTLTDVAAHLNGELDRLNAQLQTTTDPAALAELQTQIEQCQSPRSIAAGLYRALGEGVPETTMETWIRSTDFKQSAPVLFKVSCADSVIGIPLQRPLIMIGLAPTINMFGCYFGTDKIGHFFQQGYENYELDMQGRSQGLNETERRKRIVAKGKDLENGVFGLLLSGIYSNGDLAADYAGYKFYLNLTEPVAIGAVTYPPMMELHNGRWRFNRRWAGRLMQPYISDHLNEALNPCEYEAFFRPGVRAAVEQRAPAALAFYHTTAKRELGHLEQLATWHGEDYGHSGFENLITLPGVMGLTMKPGQLVVNERPDTAMR